MGTLDAVLEPWLKKEPPEPVRMILRIGTAGLLLLGTPPHAAVTTAVALAHTRGLSPFAGLVNAVLRRVAQVGPAVLEELDSARLDTPAWLWSSWGEDARAIALAHQHEAPLDLTLRPDAHPPEGGALLPTGSIRFPPGSLVGDIPGFADGRMWVQDAAAALPARLLAPQRGERIADLCAAPGGKTGQLAAAGASVVAVERDTTRIARLRENLARWSLQADCVQADVLQWRPEQRFDAILLDAPCGATGTIRRHPDVMRLKRQSDINALVQAQDRLLAAAIDLLKPGGRLVYAVCSLQPEEGAPRIGAALARGGIRLAPFSRVDLPTLPEALTTDGYVRTHPGLWSDRGGMDGFFIARFERLG